MCGVGGSTISDSQWGTADAEVKVPFDENPELTNVLHLKRVSFCCLTSTEARRDRDERENGTEE